MLGPYFIGARNADEYLFLSARSKLSVHNAYKIMEVMALGADCEFGISVY